MKLLNKALQPTTQPLRGFEATGLALGISMKRVLAILWFLFAPLILAGGCFSVDIEFAPIKAQIPELWQSINDAFILESSGGASMIGNTVNQRLGHRRVGPYCLAGRPKSQKGQNSLLFCFNTEYRWLGEKGQKTSLEEAFDVKEKFLSLEITPLEYVP